MAAVVDHDDISARLLQHADVIVERIIAARHVVIDGALGAAFAANMREACSTVEKAKSTISVGTAQLTDELKRDDSVAFLKKSTDATVVAYMTAVGELRVVLEARLELRSDSTSFMCAEYAAGAKGYVKHRDAAPERPSGRKLSILYYLNPSWTASDGGELLLWPSDSDDCLTISPLNDRMVVFASSLEHQVLPTSAPRLAVTAWLYNRLELGLELIAEKRRLRREGED
ncbi:hypothetical protein M885DRAFT_518502 [Pelagophyceae sp. CCMP2097]|nr:hypothetical protein M885DRAFT_518502 [Pelagophyceae sp. CCMP2097]